MKPVSVAMVIVVVGVAGCSRPPGARVLMNQPRQETEHCDIAVAVLRAVVRPFDEQPLGLEKACVQQRAAANSRIYVDARFTQGEHLEDIHASSCQRDEYVIRLDWRNFSPSPAMDVVLLMFLRKDQRNLTFNAVTEDANWPRKAPGVMALSQCGSAFGSVRLGQNGWEAFVDLSQPASAL